MRSPLNEKLDRKWIEASQRIAELEAEVARLSGELSLANRTGDHLGMRVRDLKAEAEKLRTDAERY